MSEKWRPIPNWEGFYEVSSLGNVRSCDRIVTHATGVDHLHRGKVLSLQTSDGGYIFFLASRNNNARRVWVHHAVAEAFHGPRPHGMVCLHLNDNPADNRPENLRWGTQSENIRMCVEHGRQTNANKTHCKRGHPLVEWNLVGSLLRQGRRACLSCSKATTKYPISKYGESLVKTHSDKYFATLMPA